MEKLKCFVCKYRFLFPARNKINAFAFSFPFKSYFASENGRKLKILSFVSLQDLSFVPDALQK